MYKLDFGVVFAALPQLLWGCLGTFALAISGMILSMLIGVFGVVARTSSVAVLRFFIIAFVELIRNTPFLVQIYFIFFALPLMGVRLSPTVTAIIALGINGGAYAIEIIRGGVEAVPKGQIEAGAALGLNRRDIFRLIVLKPAIRAIYPALTSQFIMLTLTSSVCSSIAAFELTSVAQIVDGDTFRSFEVYFTVTGMYLFISWMMMAFFAQIFRRAFSYPTK